MKEFDVQSIEIIADYDQAFECFRERFRLRTQRDTRAVESEAEQTLLRKKSRSDAPTECFSVSRRFRMQPLY